MSFFVTLSACSCRLVSAMCLASYMSSFVLVTFLLVTSVSSPGFSGFSHSVDLGSGLWPLRSKVRPIFNFFVGFASWTAGPVSTGSSFECSPGALSDLSGSLSLGSFSVRGSVSVSPLLIVSCTGYGTFPPFGADPYVDGSSFVVT